MSSLYQHYDPNCNYSDDDMRLLYNCAALPTEMITAINCQLEPNEIAYIDYNIFGVYSKETVIRFLNDGHVLLIDLDYYEENSTTSTSGHIILVYGYVKVGNNYEFLIRDPGPVNEGMTRMFTYEEILCRSSVIQKNGELINILCVWDETIVKVTEYSSNTVPNYFGN